MNKADIKNVKQLLSEPKNIVIVAHKNPDGDAIGSSLGLYHYLIKLNHKVSVIMPNDFPDFLKWMPNCNNVIIYESQPDLGNPLLKNADIIFTLDFNDLSRVGTMQTALINAEAIKIMIDHHQQPANYPDFMYSDVEMCSTSEMIYHFMDKLGDIDKVDKNIGTCLYAGIMTDTGSFRFPSTTSKTHRVVANLIDQRVENWKIHNNVFDTNSYDKLQLLGQALKNMKVLPEYNTAYITLSQKELDNHNFKKGDTEGVVNYALSLQGVVLAAIFIENKQEQIVKISLRSKGDFSVNQLSRDHFEGGGHINAAGGRSNLSLKKTVDKFISILPNYKKGLVK